jgi:hypothetical protein
MDLFCSVVSILVLKSLRISAVGKARNNIDNTLLVLDKVKIWSWFFPYCFLLCISHVKKI